MRLTEHHWAQGGGERTLVGEVALGGVPAGIVGGRLYFLSTSCDQAPHTWWGPFAVWQGGLGVWGGIAGGTAGGLCGLHRRGVTFAPFLDAAAPGILIAQAVGRVGNSFNQELFGGPSSPPWALRIDPAHRPTGYERFATFQPTFLYELIFDLALAAGLILLGRSRRLAAGTTFALYVAGYSAFRLGGHRRGRLARQRERTQAAAGWPGRWPSSARSPSSPRAVPATGSDPRRVPCSSRRRARVQPLRAPSASTLFSWVRSPSSA